MRKLTLIILLICSITMLSGCGLLKFSDMAEKKKEMEEYNKIVNITLENYTKANILAKQEKDNLMGYLLRDESWGVVEKLEVTFNKLTEEEKDAFTINGVVYDEYFTALGADGVREVIIINGKERTMYATVIWGKEDVYSIDRVVVEK